MATPEEIAKKAQETADSEENGKGGGAKHFDQPGVRFSIEWLRTLELRRKNETGDSFRQHVEEALLFYYLHPQNDFDKKNAPPKEQLTKALEEVRSGKSTGGGAVAAAAAREAAVRKELEVRIFV